MNAQADAQLRDAGKSVLGGLPLILAHANHFADASNMVWFIGFFTGGDMSRYWCVVCMCDLPSVNGVIVHKDIPHPSNMTFDEGEVEH